VKIPPLLPILALVLSACGHPRESKTPAGSGKDPSLEILDDIAEFPRCPELAGPYEADLVSSWADDCLSDVRAVEASLGEAYEQSLEFDNELLTRCLQSDRQDVIDGIELVEEKLEELEEPGSDVGAIQAAITERLEHLWSLSDERCMK
jgi:hypothetical protein